MVSAVVNKLFREVVLFVGTNLLVTEFLGQEFRAVAIVLPCFS